MYVFIVLKQYLKCLIPFNLKTKIERPTKKIGLEWKDVFFE